MPCIHHGNLQEGFFLRRTLSHNCRVIFLEGKQYEIAKLPRSFALFGKLTKFLRWHVPVVSFMLLGSIAALLVSLILFYLFFSTPHSQETQPMAAFGNVSFRAASLFSPAYLRSYVNIFSTRFSNSRNRSWFSSDAALVGDSPERWRAALDALPPVGTRQPAIFLAHGCTVLHRFTLDKYSLVIHPYFSSNVAMARETSYLLWRHCNDRRS